MKKLLILFFIFFINSIAAYAIEDVILEQQESFLDKLSDIYYGNVENKNEISPVIRLFSKEGIEFENSVVNSIKATFLYNGYLQYNQIGRDNKDSKYNFNTVEPMITVKFNQNRSIAMFDINLTRKLDGYSNGFGERISQAYIAHNINKNQMVLIGQGQRLPNSYDGSRTVLNQEMILKSQLGRTFGNARSVGIRNISEYKYLDYDIGLYDSTRYMKDFGRGLDFTGYVMLKPFANISEKIGNFKIGTGYNIGDYNVSYNMYSIFAGYDYKKFHIHAEYANADGYNGVRESNNKAQGFYSLVSYNITPKLKILGRFDIFDQNRDIKNDSSLEYSTGITYNVFKNMDLMLNYIRTNYEYKANSNMFLFATRFII